MLGSLLVVWVACAGVPQAELPSPERREVRVETGRASESIETRVEGWLHAFALAAPDVDPALRVLDADGRVLAQDDSGERGTPLVRLRVRPGQALTLELTATGAAEGTALELQLVQLPESEDTAERIAGLRPLLAEAREAIDERRFAAARELAQAIFDGVSAVQGSATSATAFEVLSELAPLALELRADELGVATLRWLNSYVGAAFPAHHGESLDARGNLGVFLARLGRLNEAERLHTDVLELCERHLEPTDDRLQHARHNLANVLLRRGEAHRAAELQCRVYEALAAKYPRDHPLRLGAQADYGVFLTMVGEDRRALQLIEEAYAIQSTQLDPDSDSLQMLRYQYAQQLRKSGRYYEARSLVEKAESVLAQRLPENHSSLLQMRFEKAANMYQLGDFKGARSLMERVVEHLSQQLPEDDRDLMAVRRSLAGLYYADGDAHTARQLIERIYAIESEAWPADRLEFQHTLLGRAVMHQAYEEWEQSYEFAARAIEGFARHLPPDHHDFLMAQAVQAETLAQLGRGAEAIELMASVYERRMTRFGPEHIDTLRAATDLAWELAREGAVEELDELIASAADGYSRYLTTTALNLSMREATALPDEESIQWGLRAVLNLAPLLPEEHAELGARKAFQLVETTRGLAGMTRRQLRLASSGELAAELAPLRETVAAASEQVARVARAGGSEMAVRDAVLAKERAERVLQEAITTHGTTSAAAPQADPHKIAARLAENEIAVGYWRYHKTAAGAHAFESTPVFAAFVLRPNGSIERVELGPAKDIEALADRWRRAIDSGAENANEIGARLRARVVDPVADVAGDCSRWIVALDGALHLVPLDALPTERGVLGDTVRLLVRSTLAELTISLAPLEGAPRLLALGAVDYDAAELGLEEALAAGEVETGPAASDQATRVDSSTFESWAGAPTVALRGTPWESGFRALPDTGLEVREIRGLWEQRFPDAPAADLLEGDRATQEALFELAPTARYVHLATHGFFANDPGRTLGDPGPPIDKQLLIGQFITFEEGVVGMSPLTLCGLALAGANRPADDRGTLPGVVTAEELGALDLTRCELAVLSACDTGVGIVHYNGQGVSSLQKALHAAGARSVLTSLWTVSDDAARQLMTTFYRGLWAGGLTKADALWEAKRALRASRAQVRDWAGWVLSGEAR